MNDATGGGKRLVRVYLIRHGQTTANRDGICVGTTNVPLTDEGRRQAQTLAARMASEPLDAIISSDLERAVETARMIAAVRGLPVSVDERLRECSFGLWEGRPYRDVIEDPASGFQEWLAGGDEAAAPGGESWQQVCERVGAVWEEHVLGRKTGAVAIVAHAGPIRSILSRVLGIGRDQARRIDIATASISIIDCGENGPLVAALNDTAHLGRGWPRRGVQIPVRPFEDYGFSAGKR